MVFSVKIVAGVCVVAAVGVAAWWFVFSDVASHTGTVASEHVVMSSESLSGGDGRVRDAASLSDARGGTFASSSVGPIWSFPRPGMPALDVFGPCYDDTRGDDVLIASNPKAATDCFVLRNGGRDMLDFSGRRVDDAVYIRVVGKDRSSQTLVLGDADNVIEVDGTFEMRISGVRGRENILALPALRRYDIEMRQDGNDVIVRTVRGFIRLIGQAEGDGMNGIIARIILRDGEVIERSQIRVQAVVAQGTNGNDTIMDTDNDDTIFPKLGDDTIILRGGKNLILYEGGNKVISSVGTVPSQNSLHFSLNRGDVMIVPSENGRDVWLETPHGRLVLSLQMFYPVDDPRLPIHMLVFKDVTLDAAGIRFAADMYQDSKSSRSQQDRARLRN